MAVYPIEILEVWAKRYGISLESRPCANCGKDLYPEIPFAVAGWRGLKSKEHECGPKFVLKRAVSASEDEREANRQLFGELKSILAGSGDE